ncbi:MAG: aldo/keto reductase [Gammaproteobacteria bacterium]
MLGGLWPISRLTLGGGGIGQVWGRTTRAEAEATVRAAVDAGINLLDLAPSYGRGEAERVVGSTFNGKLPQGVRVTTKFQLGNPTPTCCFSIAISYPTTIAIPWKGRIDLQRPGSCSPCTCVR